MIRIGATMLLLLLATSCDLNYAGQAAQPYSQRASLDAQPAPTEESR